MCSILSNCSKHLNHLVRNNFIYMQRLYNFIIKHSIFTFIKEGRKDCLAVYMFLFINITFKLHIPYIFCSHTKTHQIFLAVARGGENTVFFFFSISGSIVSSSFLITNTNITLFIRCLLTPKRCNLHHSKFLVKRGSWSDLPSFKTLQEYQPITIVATNLGSSACMVVTSGDSFI